MLKVGECNHNILVHFISIRYIKVNIGIFVHKCCFLKYFCYIMPSNEIAKKKLKIALQLRRRSDADTIEGTNIIVEHRHRTLGVLKCIFVLYFQWIFYAVHTLQVTALTGRNCRTLMFVCVHLQCYRYLLSILCIIIYIDGSFFIISVESH